MARVWPDVVWMLLMLGYMKGLSVWYLALASVDGGKLWYVPSTGFYLVCCTRADGGDVGLGLPTVARAPGEGILALWPLQ